MAVFIVKTGRFFDASGTESDTRGALDAISQDVALAAFRTWNILLDSRIRVNQYRYMSGNRYEPRENGWVVHDDIDKPYGPWLEGVGSRNAIDGFPGYHALSEAAAQTDGEAEGIAEDRISELVERLNAP